MEIPSSSPLYTPLGSEKEWKSGPQSHVLPQVDLFPKKNSQCIATDKSNDTSSCLTYGEENTTEVDTDMEIISSIPNSPEEACVADTFTEEPLYEGRSIEDQSQNKQIEFEWNDNDSTILSDEEYMSPTQENTPQKSTQDFLEELLTESLLESLPLPPGKKSGLRGYRKKP